MMKMRIRAKLRFLIARGDPIIRLMFASLPVAFPLRSARTYSHRGRLLDFCQSIFFLLSLCPQLDFAAVPDQTQAQQHAIKGFDLAQKGDLNGAETELR